MPTYQEFKFNARGNVAQPIIDTRTLEEAKAERREYLHLTAEKYLRDLDTNVSQRKKALTEFEIEQIKNGLIPSNSRENRAKNFFTSVVGKRLALYRIIEGKTTNTEIDEVNLDFSSIVF